MKTTEKLNLFDIISNINGGKKSKDVLKGVSAYNDETSLDPSNPEKVYASYMINRGFSYFNDTACLANEMNMRHHLPPRMQYDFLKNTIRPRKRFSKWFKAMADDEDIELIKKHYDYSSVRAREVYPLFNEDQLKELRGLYQSGGKE